MARRMLISGTVRRNGACTDPRPVAGGQPGRGPRRPLLYAPPTGRAESGSDRRRSWGERLRMVRSHREDHGPAGVGGGGGGREGTYRRLSGPAGLFTGRRRTVLGAVRTVGGRLPGGLGGFGGFGGRELPGVVRDALAVGVFRVDGMAETGGSGQQQRAQDERQESAGPQRAASGPDMRAWGRDRHGFSARRPPSRRVAREVADWNRQGNDGAITARDSSRRAPLTGDRGHRKGCGASMRSDTNPY